MLKKQLEEAKEATPKWIETISKLPENWTDVLVYNEDTKELSVGYYYDSLGWYLQNGELMEVTHWMPLPEPPKEVKPDAQNNDPG